VGKPETCLARVPPYSLHGMAGGIMSTMGGGKFGHGFASADGTQLSSVMIDQIGNGAASYKAHRIMAAAVVGGTIAEVTGGKFANGALTGAFSRAFNAETHSARERAKREGDNLLEPYAALDPNATGTPHDYPIGPTPLCQRNETGCGQGLNPLIAEDTCT